MQGRYRSILHSTGVTQSLQKLLHGLLASAQNDAQIPSKMESENKFSPHGKNENDSKTIKLPRLVDNLRVEAKDDSDEMGKKDSEEPKVCQTKRQDIHKRFLIDQPPADVILLQKTRYAETPKKETILVSTF